MPREPNSAWKRLLFTFFLCLLAGCGSGPAPVYPQRWVYVTRDLGDDGQVEDIRRIARVASEHGLNGLALDGGLDRMDLQPPEYLRRLEQVNRIAKQYSLEIIPVVFSAGYGASVIAHNRNLAERLPVREALFVAAGREARLAPDPPVLFANGGFEEHEGDRLKGYRKQTAPGRTSFVDTSVFHNGAASLRFDNTGQEPVAVMLDPNHNARRDYYLAEGDYTGSWNYIPKDLQIVCWLHGKRAASLAHFSRHGFPTIAGAYYDAETLEDSEGWLKALDKTPGAVGIMYTTWQDKYGLMAQFGDLVTRRKGPDARPPAGIPGTGK